MQQQTGSARSYELLLIAVIAARATSFIFSKMILESLAPFNLLAVRLFLTKQCAASPCAIYLRAQLLAQPFLLPWRVR